MHLILGLPGESLEQMLQTIDYLAHFSPKIDGVKLQLLHVLKGTDLARLYECEPFPVFSMDEYVEAPGRGGYLKMVNIAAMRLIFERSHRRKILRTI